MFLKKQENTAKRVCKVRKNEYLLDNEAFWEYIIIRLDYTNPQKCAGGDVG